MLARREPNTLRKELPQDFRDGTRDPKREKLLVNDFGKTAQNGRAVPDYTPLLTRAVLACKPLNGKTVEKSANLMPA